MINSKAKREAIVKKKRPTVTFDSPAGSAPVSPRSASPVPPPLDLAPVAPLPVVSVVVVPSASAASGAGKDDIDPERKAKIVNSFLPPQAGPQTNIEILFSFDTTGSMASCIDEVRKRVSETVSRLLEDVPGIRIAIVAHGDYCDGARMISTLDFSSDKNKIVNFVNSVKGTSGGDVSSLSLSLFASLLFPSLLLSLPHLSLKFPEAYEVVLKRAQSLTWTPHFSKAIVMIGDAIPHEAEDPQNK
jgi:hypothetical protein